MSGAQEGAIAGGEPARPAAGAGVRIRALRPEDHDAVADLVLTAYLEGGHLDPADTYREILADVPSRAAIAEILVAELDVAGEPGAEPGVTLTPRVVGSVVLAPPGSPMAETAREGEYEFRMLAVHPAFHRRGVARALLGEVIARARAAVGVHALGLYESVGFRRTPERDWLLSDVIEGITPEEEKGPFPVYVLALD